MAEAGCKDKLSEELTRELAALGRGPEEPTFIYVGSKRPFFDSNLPPKTARARCGAASLSNQLRYQIALRTGSGSRRAADCSLLKTELHLK